MSSADTIVVKLVEGTVVDLAQLQMIAPAAVVEPLAPDIDPSDLRRLTDEARDADPGADIPDLSLLFAARFPDASDEIVTAATALLNAAPLIEYADRALDSVQNGVVPPLLQQYLDDADTGLRLDPVRAFVGGGGAQIRVAVADDLDFDRGHPDLTDSAGNSIVDARTPVATATVTDSINHSTGVLSVAQSAAPDAQLVYAGTKRPNVAAQGFSTADTSDVFQTLVFAALALRAGDVLSCSMGFQAHPLFDTGTGSGIKISSDAQVCLENDRTIARLLRLITSRGVIVVIASGNGTTRRSSQAVHEPFDLDAHPEVTLTNSGAIVVGGMQPVFHLPTLVVPASLKRYSFATFGSRITCSGWAANIFAAVDSNTATPPFRMWAGTSFATPMIAGALASLQGISLAKNGTVLSQVQMVALLNDPALGVDWAPGGKVGLFPQISQMVTRI
jgi:subtilase family protein